MQHRPKNNHERQCFVAVENPAEETRFQYTPVHRRETVVPVSSRTHRQLFVFHLSSPSYFQQNFSGVPVLQRRYTRRCNKSCVWAPVYHVPPAAARTTPPPST